ncbi:MAG TPA: FAD-dependent oxidoreductase [Burkholderiales bacterium]|nr:FAD-dependent oxidoreductase [Burkholderiales bacterium]
MTEQLYDYVIVGAGLAGAFAIEGIRERDAQRTILLVGAEPQRPYNRPPLSKQLWTGKETLDGIFAHDLGFYAQHGVTLATSTEIVGLDVGAKAVVARDGQRYRYAKLLLATGGHPRTLSIPGGDLDGIVYFRTYQDYVRLRGAADKAKSAVVIGGGFIGSEIAAALNMVGLEVSMIFPEPYLVSRVFPEPLGRAIQKSYVDRGMRIIAGDRPVSIARSGERFTVRTQNGIQTDTDVVVVGIGIAPELKLAAQAGLKTANGIVVTEHLQTSDPEVYAAGDNAFFPYRALGKSMRVEHWDNAINQGKYAGRNMAGASEPYDYMPFFFSDLFDFGYEAVGEVDSSLETYADWHEKFRTGVIYYLADSVVKGVMLCNVWKKVDAARQLIQKEERCTRESLRGAIR